MYEIDEFGCFVLPKHDSDLCKNMHTTCFPIVFVANNIIIVFAVKAYRYYRTAIICAQEMSDQVSYEEEERCFNVETYVRWYEAIEKAVVIWLYYLGGRVYSSTGRVGVHTYHEAVLESLSHRDNPFFEIFNRPYLLACLRKDKQRRNKWRHDTLTISNPCGSWEVLAAYLTMVNDALEDALNKFTEIRVGT